ncbi:unnamed protein product [Trifolium pratense]|uniref:Uncharacterized protein n=1 Tax=Trifolium pratense TaxID=57577 RepID=A0ACB0LT35_TRIPR|nr:unnamed protein product [Trifolium pratense]
MEQQEQINAALREDVDSIKTTMGKLLELFQNLVTKENTPQPPGSTERPELGLPKGYTPPEEGDPNHTPIIIPVTNGDPPPRGVSMLKEASSQPHHATKAVAQGQYPQPVYPMTPAQQKPQERQNGYQHKNPQKNQPSLERKNVPFDQLRFDPVPLSYGQILPYLIQKGLVEPRPLPPAKKPYPPGFDMNVRCDYHAGSPGHNIEDCRAFKYKVQELIDRKLLSFKEEADS